VRVISKRADNRRLLAGSSRMIREEKSASGFVEEADGFPFSLGSYDAQAFCE